MKLGVGLAGLEPALYSDAAREAERLGFESVWIPERPSRPDSPGFDPFAYLASVAAKTTVLRLGVQVYLLALRHPLAVARAVQVLDRTSAGRAAVVVGAEPAQSALRPERPQQARRLNEAITLCKRLWTEDVVEHSGESFRLEATRFEPKPVQRPWPPLHIAGESEAEIWRAARMGDGWFATDGEPGSVESRIELLHRYQAEAETLDGRFEISLRQSPEVRGELKRWRDLGIDRVILSPWVQNGGGLDALRRLGDVVNRSP